MQTAWDDGTAPSTDTCGGVACTNIAPETPGYLGYAIRIPSRQATPLTIYGNGATIVSGYGAAQAGVAAYSLSAPYFAVFGSDQPISGWNLYDVNINRAFIVAATKGAAYWRWSRVSLNTVGIAVLAGSSQYDSFKDLFIQNATAGVIIGGWWGTRAPYTSCERRAFVNVEDLGDATSLDGIVFYGWNWGTLSQSQMAQNALDSWFNTNFFHVGDNQTRLTDQNKAGLGVIPDSMWRGHLPRDVCGVFAVWPAGAGGDDSQRECEGDAELSGGGDGGDWMDDRRFRHGRRGVLQREHR